MRYEHIRKDCRKLYGPNNDTEGLEADRELCRENFVIFSFDFATVTAK